MNSTEETNTMNQIHRELFEKLGHEDETYKLFTKYYGWWASNHKR